MTALKKSDLIGKVTRIQIDTKEQYGVVKERLINAGFKPFWLIGWDEGMKTNFGFNVNGTHMNFTDGHSHYKNDFKIIEL